MKRFLSRCALSLALAAPCVAGCSQTGCEVRGPSVSLYAPCDGSGVPPRQPFERLRSDRACYPPAGAPCPSCSARPPVLIQSPAPPLATHPPRNLGGYGAMPRGPENPGAAPIATEPPASQPGQGPIVRLSVPEPMPLDKPRDPVKPDKPQSPEPPATAKKPAPEDQGGTPSLPVGIARFAEVKPEKIACGLKPHPVDGLSWLQARGYRTVLHVRHPGETGPADRRVIEKAGLRYVSLDASAATLSKELADQFARLVNDPTNQPVFVYDQDGALTGVLWYLYFRNIENLPEDQAKTRAARLGFKEDGSDEARALWAAVKRIQ